MFTPTSRAVALALGFGLTACAASLTGADRASLRVEGQRISVVAPEGLCIDPTSPDVGRAGGYLLIGDCALFSRKPEGVVTLPGVITVSVSAGGLPGDLDILAEFLEGPGKSGLSRARDASTVTILETRRTSNALLVKIRDRAPAAIPGEAADYWRVFFPAGGRLITAALVGFSDARIPDGRALSLLSGLETRTAAANPVRETAPDPQEVSQTSPASEVTEGDGAG